VEPRAHWSTRSARHPSRRRSTRRRTAGPLPSSLAALASSTTRETIRTCHTTDRPATSTSPRSVNDEPDQARQSESGETKTIVCYCCWCLTPGGGYSGAMTGAAARRGDKNDLSDQTTTTTNDCIGILKFTYVRHRHAVGASRRRRQRRRCRRTVLCIENLIRERERERVRVLERRMCVHRSLNCFAGATRNTLFRDVTFGVEERESNASK
jgi:hypothetical protein